MILMPFGALKVGSHEYLLDTRLNTLRQRARIQVRLTCDRREWNTRALLYHSDKAKRHKGATACKVGATF